MGGLTPRVRLLSTVCLPCEDSLVLWVSPHGAAAYYNIGSPRQPSAAHCGKMNKWGEVPNETVVLRWWGSVTREFGFIN